MRDKTAQSHEPLVPWADLLVINSPVNRGDFAAAIYLTQASLDCTPYVCLMMRCGLISPGEKRGRMHRIAALASQPFSRLILSVLPHYSGVTCWAWINWKVTEDHAETDEMSNVMEFTLGDYSIDSPEELNIPLGGTGNITVDDVVAADWNITKAITEKIIDNQSFVENVTHVEVPSDDTQPDGSGCSTHHAEYNSTFTASVEGTTIAGGLPANDQDSLVSEICFDPLGIVAVVVDD